MWKAPKDFPDVTCTDIPTCRIAAWRCMARSRSDKPFCKTGSRPQSATCGCIRSCDTGGGGAAGSKPKLLEIVGKMASNIRCWPLTCKAIVCYAIFALVLVMGCGADGVGKPLTDSGGQF